MYLESASRDYYPGARELETELSKLAEQGKLVQCSDGLFKLVEPPIKKFAFVVEPTSVAQAKTTSDEALIRLVANGLYEIRQRLGPGREDGLSPRVAIAARLAYALHNEALHLMGEPYEADLDGALRRIAMIDRDFSGERLLQSFSEVGLPTPPDS